jgi:hypothetical protein
MKISQILVGRENLGIVRQGFSGARTMLLKNGNDFFFVFVSSKGKEKNKIKAKEGLEYLVGPDFVKEYIPLERDTYWPRRWAREYGRHAHMTYFRLMEETEVFEFNQGVREASWLCPDTLLKILLTPLNGHPFTRCLINKKWLKTATYAQFCWAMIEERRESSFKEKVTALIKSAVEDFKLSAEDGAELRISVEGGNTEYRAAIHNGRVVHCVPCLHGNGWTYNLCPVGGAGVESLLIHDMECLCHELLKEKTADEVLFAVKIKASPKGTPGNITTR